jgi:hypothetical protein
MNKCREEAIDNLIRRIPETHEDLLIGIRGCGYDCSSIMYGALAKAMHSNDLLSPRPTAPFPGINYKGLVQKVLAFESPQWTFQNSYYSIYGSSKRHLCLESSFESLFGGLNDSLNGLHLHSYIP